jgi:hypothetical protein
MMDDFVCKSSAKISLRSRELGHVIIFR